MTRKDTGFDYDVFLSYSSTDQRIVSTLAERLEKDDVRVWMDKTRLGAGAPVSIEIAEALEKSRKLVMCISPAYLESEWGKWERHSMMANDPNNKKRRVIPLLIKQCKRPPSISSLKYIDWRRRSKKAYKELLAECRDQDPPNDPPQPWPILIWLVMVCLAVALIWFWITPSARLPDRNELDKAAKVLIELPKSGHVLPEFKGVLGPRTRVELNNVYVPKDAHLYICEFRMEDTGGLIWPKAECIDGPANRTSWKTKVGLGSGRGGSFEMRLYLVSNRAARMIDDWLDRGIKSESFDGFQENVLPGIRQLGESVYLHQKPVIRWTDVELVYESNEGLKHSESKLLTTKEHSSASVEMTVMNTTLEQKRFSLVLVENSEDSDLFEFGCTSDNLQRKLRLGANENRVLIPKEDRDLYPGQFELRRASTSD